jgi:hypothetical protein
VFLGLAFIAVPGFASILGYSALLACNSAQVVRVNLFAAFLGLGYGRRNAGFRF